MSAQTIDQAPTTPCPQWCVGLEKHPDWEASDVDLGREHTRMVSEFSGQASAYGQLADASVTFGLSQFERFVADWSARTMTYEMPPAAVEMRITTSTDRGGLDEAGVELTAEQLREVISKAQKALAALERVTEGDGL